MKISIGTKIKNGPWGGGNLFAVNLSNYLKMNGHDVVFDLQDSDIDIVLITEPRKTSESSAYTHADVEKYKKYVKQNVGVIHRINECDERKGTNYVNKYLINANKIADETVYVSKWLKDLYVKQGIKSPINKVIYAGADEKIFYPEQSLVYKNQNKLKVCTHHWGSNWNKGFDAYLLLDKLLSQKKWKNKLEFTYIGNVHKNANFKNTTIIEPLSGTSLGQKLREHNFYITGSLNEPSGNHHIEAAQSGLPVMYINSGGVTEYCKDYGIEYTLDNLEEKLEQMISSLEEQKKLVQKYPFSSSKMCEEYLDIFLSLHSKKNNEALVQTNLKKKTFEGVIYRLVRFLKKKFF